jgi:hypothetical protein
MAWGTHPFRAEGARQTRRLPCCEFTTSCSTPLEPCARCPARSNVTTETLLLCSNARPAASCSILPRAAARWGACGRSDTGARLGAGDDVVPAGGRALRLHRGNPGAARRDVESGHRHAGPRRGVSGRIRGLRRMLGRGRGRLRDPPLDPRDRPMVHQAVHRVADVRPTVHHHRPSAANDRPTVHHRRPSVADDRPTVHHHRPSVADVRPTVHHHRPSVADVRPTVHHHRPSVHQRSHRVANDWPSVHHRRPSVHHLEERVAHVKEP